MRLSYLLRETDQPPDLKTKKSKYYLKRLTYISRLSLLLTEKEIENIGSVSAYNNSKFDITGLLVYFHGLFFQIIEGDNEAVELLYEKIKQDCRHTDILCLKSENDIQERLFPDWSMKTVNLDNTTDELLRPIKILLQTLAESHTIIERYTQPAVLKIINKGINPLTLAPVPSEKIVLFSDVVAYSIMSEKLSMNDLMLILNTYFEICGRVILKWGGEINKFIGDGVMAYFDVSFTDCAIHACLEMTEVIENLRRIATEDSPLTLLHAGFGLAKGMVIEGNMGSQFKMDYTIVGDAVNTAARLESLTREVKHTLVLSELVKNTAKEAWNFISLGKFNLKGKQEIIEVYSVEHKVVNKFPERNALCEAINSFCEKYSV